MSKPTKDDESRPREPQSYGSEKDWLEGKTDQTVYDTPQRTSRHDEDFYRNEHDKTPPPKGDRRNLGATVEESDTAAGEKGVPDREREE